jgi:hypothetical protein
MLRTLPYMMKRHIIILLSVYSLLAGCSWIKTYQSLQHKNLHIETGTDSGSIFSKVRAAVDIYQVDESCKAEYEGTVQLNTPSVDLGIPSNRLSYLVFVFARSGVLSSTSSTITYSTLLLPHIDYNYDIKVSYIDDIYNVVIRETDPRKKKSREIERKDLNDCGSF